ncbi:MAG: DNA polymerase IV [Chloroflexota bacterium]
MTETTRIIIHLDLDAFYCAVEEQLDPRLRGKVFAVGGRPDGRGVVTSCSYAARQLGIRSAMPMSRAVGIAPDLIIRRGQHEIYGQKSRQVMSVLRGRTSLVEQISIDEAFLDVTELTDTPLEYGKSLQQEILQTSQLPCSLGIASNKLVAKIATDVGKASVKTTTYPNAIQLVSPGHEAEFLAPLPIEMLWGVGPKTAERLAGFNIFTIGELAAMPQAEIAAQFGKSGYDLHRRAQGIDQREIVTHREPKSHSQEVTFGKDITDRTRLHQQIQKQSEKVGKSLEKANQVGSTIKLKLRWSDFTTISRQTTLPLATNDPELINETALKLFNDNWDGKAPVRLIGVGVAQLQAPNRQLSLWDKTDYKKLAKIESALFEVKQRFGEEIISKGISEEAEKD